MRRWWFLKVQQGVYRRLARFDRRVHGRGPLLVAIGDSLTDPQCAYTLPRKVWPRIVGREGYRTVNLGVSGETTADMRRRIEHTLNEGQPEIAVLFGGANDAVRRVDPAETEQNVAFMVEWLRDRGIRKIALIGPGFLNFAQTPDWVSAADEVRTVLSDVAERYGAIFVDLAMFLRHRIDRGEDPSRFCACAVSTGALMARAGRRRALQRVRSAIGRRSLPRGDHRLAATAPARAGISSGTEQRRENRPRQVPRLSE
jgi:lysophospholipase L1-like esterase